MSTGQGLEGALVELETLARRGEKPGHYLARHLLIELGQVLALGPAGAAVERAQAAGNLVAPAWKSAVETELSLACGEFAQSLDPRFLALPGYDLAYTRTARARLGDRLRAASELGFQLQPREVDVLALADQVFEAFLRQRGDEGGSARPAEASGSAPASPKRPSRHDTP